MKTAIIIHGRPEKEEYYDNTFPSPSNSHWLPWLQHELLMRDILTQTPEMPRAFAPDYDAWKECFEQFQVDENTILVGHSRGASFLLRWLNENTIKIKQLVLVAPAMQPNPGVVTGFSDFPIAENLFDRTSRIDLFYSLDDNSQIVTSTKIISEAILGIHVHTYTDKGHFTKRDGFETFPELLEAIVS